MRSPEADAAGRALQAAVVEARNHLTREAVIFDAVSATYALEADADWRPPMWPGKSAIETAQSVVRGLDPAEMPMDDPTPRPKPAAWRRALMRLALVATR